MEIQSLFVLERAGPGALLFPTNISPQHRQTAARPNGSSVFVQVGPRLIFKAQFASVNQEEGGDWEGERWGWCFFAGAASRPLSVMLIESHVSFRIPKGRPYRKTITPLLHRVRQFTE